MVHPSELEAHRAWLQKIRADLSLKRKREERGEEGVELSDEGVDVSFDTMGATPQPIGADPYHALSAPDVAEYAVKNSTALGETGSPTAPKPISGGANEVDNTSGLRSAASAGDKPNLGAIATAVNNDNANDPGQGALAIPKPKPSSGSSGTRKKRKPK